MRRGAAVPRVFGAKSRINQGPLCGEVVKLIRAITHAHIHIHNSRMIERSRFMATSSGFKCKHATATTMSCAWCHKIIIHPRFGSLELDLLMFLSEPEE